MDPTGKHEGRAENIKGKTRGGTRESLNRQVSITQGLDHRTHKVAQDSKSTKVRIQRNRSSPRGGLESTRGSSHKGVLNPSGSSPKRPRSLTNELNQR